MCACKPSGDGQCCGTAACHEAARKSGRLKKDEACPYCASSALREKLGPTYAEAAAQIESSAHAEAVARLAAPHVEDALRMARADAQDARRVLHQVAAVLGCPDPNAYDLVGWAREMMRLAERVPARPGPPDSTYLAATLARVRRLVAEECRPGCGSLVLFPVLAHHCKGDAELFVAVLASYRETPAT